MRIQFIIILILILLLLILGCEKINSQDLLEKEIILENSNLTNQNSTKNNLNNETNVIKKEITKKTIQYQNIEEVDSNLLSLDIYYINEEYSPNNPIIIYVHGGGWTLGDKENEINDKVNLFTGLNYTFVSVNYRLSSFRKNNIKFPIHNQDVAKAIKYIYNNSKNYNSDNSKIILMGHSAGAHLVSLTGTNEEFLESEGLDLEIIKGVISLDTAGFDVKEKVESNERLYVNAFGTNEENLIRASPLLNIEPNKDIPPFLVTIRGNEQRVKEAEKFISKLERNNIEVERVDVFEYSHREVNEAVGQKDETILTPSIISFIKNLVE